MLMMTDKTDTNKRWVRVLNITANGFVEFEFFISDADLFVELILPKAAFNEFCINNKVTIEKSQGGVLDQQHNGLLKLVK